MRKECIINLIWDKDAAVWIATSEDIPGLVLESESLDDLIEKVREAVPELLMMNHNPSGYTDMSFATQRSEAVMLYG